MIGGLIGALAGGIPAWLLARRESNVNLKRDKEERERQQKSLVFAVHVKLVTVINSTITNWEHVQRSLAKLELPETAHMEPWQILQPLSGETNESEIRFLPEELAIFLEAGANDLMHDMMLIAQRHSVSVDALRTYRVDRERLIERAPIPDEMDGTLGKGMITKEEMRKLSPQSLALNDLVRQIRFGLKMDVELCRTVAAAIGPTVKTYFKDPKFGGLTFPTKEELAKMIAGPNEGSS